MSEDAWYYVNSGERFGPVSLANLKRLISSLPNPERCLVWSAKLPDWTAAGDINELQPLTPPPIPNEPQEPPRPEWRVRWWWYVVALFCLGSIGSQDGRTAMQWASRNRAERRRIRYGNSVVDDKRPNVATAAPLPSSNYITRHWRGDLSLPVSYWVNGFLGNIATAGAIIFLGKGLDFKDEFRPEIALASATAIWATIVLVATWQVVGVWRSATHYSEQHVRSYWGGIAKFVVFLAALKLGGQILTNAIPQITEFARIYAGDASVGKYKFHVINDGRELELVGGITFGAAKDLESFADALSSLKTVRLTSNGGRISEAARIAAQIRKRGLNTYVPTYCVSACTIAFLGGQQRLVGTSAKLGFHQPDFPGISAEDRRELIAEEERRLTSLGVSPAFARKVNSTPPSDMWFPTLSELKSGGLVTKTLDIDDSPVSYEAFVTREGKFSIDFGGVPKLTKGTGRPANGVSYDSYTWSTGGTTVYKAVVMFVYSESIKVSFDGAIAGAAQNAKAQLVKEQPVKLADFEGREAFLETQDSMEIRLRYFFIGGRLYQLMVVAHLGETTTPAANAFFDSFHFTF
ncbi:GYF domain-containing protein [Rhodopseudomonas palustris]|uniref:GYF domain-containing protein n=2 Tax=Rhodopseudomonas palustris TaxID=1076 RepID=UPI001304FC29|nr:GYF domain-containing protein [Rhodopseudomonas palustris]